MSAIPVAAPPLLHAPGFWKRALGHRSFALGAVLTLLMTAWVGPAALRTLHAAEAEIAQRLPQGRETTAANTAVAAPRPELIHPGVRRYLTEIGLLTR